MSYEYFLQAHLDEEDQQISTEKILAAFEKYITKKHEHYIDVRFDEVNSCTIYINTRSSTVSHLMIERPCDAQLGECLYHVMLLGNFVFFEPDGKHPIIIDAGTENHLPKDMIESLGKPIVGKDLNTFLELYHNNR